MVLRLECEKDYAEVENVTREAFWDVYHPGCDEHLVLHNLRGRDAFIRELDYVAVKDGRIAGNIVYSRTFRGNKMSKDIITFGPISVLPDCQKEGIGKSLIQKSIQKAAELGYKAVVITGSPAYYNRFGFRTAAEYGLYLPGMAEDEEASYFMVKELVPGFLKQHSGIVEFDKCFKTNKSELEIFEKKFPSKVKREPREDDI